MGCQFHPERSGTAGQPNPEKTLLVFNMEIFPAIDLKNRQCVRLTQGNFSAVTIYESDPVKQAHKFAAAGAGWLHMVDLDGARAGGMRQLGVYRSPTSQGRCSVKLQVGGGVYA